MTKKELKRTAEWLDERWSFIQHTKDGTAKVDGNETYYRGAIDAIIFLGLSWKRNADGKHIIIK